MRLGGLFSIFGSVILFNSVDVQALSGAELAHFIFVLVLVNLPTSACGDSGIAVHSRYAPIHVRGWLILKACWREKAVIEPDA